MTATSQTPRAIRRQRSKNGERRERTLMQVDKAASELTTQLAIALQLSKADVINFALTSLAQAVQERATEQELAAANGETDVQV